MKNIILDGQTYSGISEVSLPVSGGTALFKDKDEIIEPIGSLSVTANGTYDVTDKASAVVNVPAPEINLQTKTATTNGDVVADEGYDGLEKVIVAVSGDIPTLITKSITENGTYNASADNADGYSSVTVNVPAPEVNLQDKTVTANGTVTADEGYDGLGEVVVNVSGGGAGVDMSPRIFTFKKVTLESDSTTFTVDFENANLNKENTDMLYIINPNWENEKASLVDSAFAFYYGITPSTVFATKKYALYATNETSADGTDYYVTGVSFSFNNGIATITNTKSRIFKGGSTYCCVLISTNS